MIQGYNNNIFSNYMFWLENGFGGFKTVLTPYF